MKRKRENNIIDNYNDNYKDNIIDNYNDNLNVFDNFNEKIIVFKDNNCVIMKNNNILFVWCDKQININDEYLNNINQIIFYHCEDKVFINDNNNIQFIVFDNCLSNEIYDFKNWKELRKIYIIGNNYVECSKDVIIIFDE